MTPDETITVLKEATDTFGDISVKPTDNDMSRMNKTLLPILLEIPDDQVDATHNLSGLITPSVKYTKKYGTAFKCSKRPKPYCTTITATMPDADQRKSKATHSSQKEDYQLYKAIEIGTMRFLTMTVDKM